VLVGATIDELHDKFPTPYGGEWTSGVEIQANFLDMVLTGNYLKKLNPWLFLLIEVVLLIGLWFLFKVLKPQFSALALLGLLIILFIINLLLFNKAGIICPIAQTIILLILIYVASILNHYWVTMKEKRFIRNAFQQYLAPELVNQLLANPKLKIRRFLTGNNCPVFRYPQFYYLFRKTLSSGNSQYPPRIPYRNG